MNAIAISTAQLTSGEQEGMWPVFSRANWMIWSSWGGSDIITCHGYDTINSTWIHGDSYVMAWYLVSGVDHVRN